MNGDEVLRQLEDRKRKSDITKSPGERAEAPQPSRETRSVRLIAASSIAPVEAMFVFAPYVQRGELTWIEGSTKSGKTFSSIDLIARGTRGEAHPLTGESIAANRAAILTCEDSPESTVVPRLIAAGANLDRVSIVRVEDTATGEGRIPSFVRDLAGLAERLRDERIDLLLVDGSFGVLGVADGNDYAEAYRVMLPVVGMVRDLRIGAMLLRHTRKSDANALQRGIGSVGYASLARSTVSVAVDRDDESGKRRIWAHAGANAIESGPTLAFSIEGTQVASFTRSVGCVRWLEVVEGVAADDLDRSRAPDDAADRSAAEEFLREFLGEPRSATEVFAQAERARIPRRTVQRVANRLGVIIERRGFGEGSIWSLPAPAAAPIRDAEGHSRHSRQAFIGGMNGANEEAGTNGSEFIPTDLPQKRERFSIYGICGGCRRLAYVRGGDRLCRECAA